MLGPHLEVPMRIEAMGAVDDIQELSLIAQNGFFLVELCLEQAALHQVCSGRHFSFDFH